MLTFVSEQIEHMPRNKCHRKTCFTPGVTYYKPTGIPLKLLDEVVLEIDELEAIRLADAQGLYHEDAAKQMGISRQTFGRIVESARGKVAKALITGKAIKINSSTTTENCTERSNTDTSNNSQTKNKEDKQ